MRLNNYTTLVNARLQHRGQLTFSAFSSSLIRALLQTRLSDLVFGCCEGQRDGDILVASGCTIISLDRNIYTAADGPYQV